MKIHSIHRQGSVLIIALLTITILTMICATSLYVTSQNANATTQTTSWQQALAGAEAAVDQAMNALNRSSTGNAGAWTGWYTVTGSLPKAKPTDNTTPATGAPAVGQYNYYVPPSLSLQGEASNTMKMWVTVDPVASSFATSAGQSYRIRATGLVGAPGPARVSNQKLDNDLRKISLRFDRSAGGTVTTPQASRTIEVVAQPTTTTTSNGTMGIVTRNAFTVGGGSRIDSFNSTDKINFPNGTYTLTAWQAAWQSAQTDLKSGNSTLVQMGTNLANELSGGNVGIINSTGSNLNNGPYVYGSLTYSGPALKGKTKNIYGTISTPFNATVSQVKAPTGTALPLPAPGANNAITINIPAGTTQQAPVLYQGSLPQNASIVVNSPRDPVTNLPLPGTAYVELSVTGDLNIAGNGSTNGTFTQDSHVNTAFYVQGNITLAGNSITNGSGLAQNFIVYGVTPTDGSARTASVSGNGTFIGVVDAPAYDISYTGNGDVVGALLGNTLNVSGNGNLHYDEALDSKLGFFSSAATYSYASWFEDNGDKARGQTF